MKPFAACSPAEVVLRAYSRVAPAARGAYPLVRLARPLIPRRRWRSTFRTPDGLALDLDLSTYPDCCMAFGLYELDSARLMKRLLRPGDHFVDGGANIGYFTMLAAQHVGGTGRVDAFEPQPENRARLEAHLALNGLGGGVAVHAAALSDRTGTAAIHMFSGERFNHGCASLFAEADDAARTSEVPTVRMDDVLRDTHPRLVKLDLEGAESLAIAGMEGLLASAAAPRLIVEFNPQSARRAGAEPREWIDRLRALQPDYKLHLIGRRLRAIEDADLTTLGQINVLAVCGSESGETHRLGG